MAEEVFLAVVNTALSVWSTWATNILALPVLLWQLLLLGLFF